MNIYDLKLKPIERIVVTSSEEALRLMSGARKPMIISGLTDDFEFIRNWDLDFFSKMEAEVPVQRPEADGVNYFINYLPMAMREVVDRIRAGDDIYIGAKKIMGARGERSDSDGLGELASKIKLPLWIDKQRLHSANLWIGAGNNNTLLHYDAWDSILMLSQGEKEFVVLPETETARVHQYSAFDFKSLVEGRVLHSKIKPLNVQEAYQEEFSKVEGFRGKITGGDLMFVPAGFWHFVESAGLNVAVNFFVHVEDRRLHLREPLRTFWIKDNITLWPVRWYWKLKEKAAKTFRFFFPKRVIN